MFVVKPSRIAVHNWVTRADRQPDSDVAPHQSVVNMTVIRDDGARHWLYAAVDPARIMFPYSTVSGPEGTIRDTVTS